MTDRDDPGIPTLTLRATNAHELPVLTEVAQPFAWTDSAAASNTTSAAALNRYDAVNHQGTNVAPPPPADTVLRAALQADIEDAVQNALDEALHQVKARLEAELPDIVARAVRRTRLG